MTALSVSISTRGSPTVTVSPGCLCQAEMAPSVIVSDRRGILISIMGSDSCRAGPAAHGGQRLADGADHVVLRRQGRGLQGFRIRHRDLGRRDAADGGIQVVE